MCSLYTLLLWCNKVVPKLNLLLNNNNNTTYFLINAIPYKEVSLGLTASLTITLLFAAFCKVQCLKTCVSCNFTCIMMITLNHLSFNATLIFWKRKSCSSKNSGSLSILSWRWQHVVPQLSFYSSLSRWSTKLVATQCTFTFFQNALNWHKWNPQH